MSNTRKRRSALFVIGAGVAVGFGWGPSREGLAHPGEEPRPASRFAAPQALPRQEATARAAPFDYLAADAKPTAAPPSASSSTVPSEWTNKPPVAPTAMAMATEPAKSGSLVGSAWKDVRGWMSTQTKATKAAITGPPDAPTAPRVGQPQAAKAPPPANAPLVGRAPGGGTVYAGAPAYRWFGWGTTTPGQNPYAPSGDYAPTSATWYAQTGATPGAFPVPVANPFRAPPGPTTPAYAVQPAPAAMPAPQAPPGFRAIARSQPQQAQTRPAPPPVSEPKWTPTTVPTLPAPMMQTPPIFRGQVPTADPLDAQIQAACQGLVKDVRLSRPAEGQVKIYFTATTETLAEIAARAISAIPELKPLDVQFEATLLAR